MNMKNLLLNILYYLNIITLTAIMVFFLYVKIMFDSRATTSNSSIKFCLSEIGQCKTAVTMYDVVYFKKSEVPVCALKDSPSTSSCYPEPAYQTCIYGLTLTESILEGLTPNTSHVYIPLFLPIVILSFVSIVAYLIFDKEFVDISSLSHYCFLFKKQYFLVLSRVISGAVAALLIISAKIFTVVFSEDCTSTTSDYCTKISACKSEIKSILVTDDVAIQKYNVILVSFIGFLILGIMISSWESILHAIVFEDTDDRRTRSLFSRALETSARDIMTRNWNLEVKMKDDNLECPICLGIMKMSTTIRKQLSHSESTVPIDNNELNVKPSPPNKSPRLPFHHGNVVPFNRSLTTDSATQFAPMTLLHKPGYIGRIVEVEEKSTDVSFEEQDDDQNNDYIVDFRQATNSSSSSSFPLTSTLSYDQERQFFMKRKNSYPYTNNNNFAGYSGNTHNNHVVHYLESDMSMESFYWSPNSSRSMDDRAGGSSDMYNNTSYDFMDTCRVMMKRDLRKENSVYSRSQFRMMQQSDSPRQLLSSPTAPTTTPITTSSNGNQSQVLAIPRSREGGGGGNDIESANIDIHHTISPPLPATSTTTTTPTTDSNYSSSSPFSSYNKIKGGGSTERREKYLRKKTFESLQSFDSTSQASSYQLTRHPMTMTTSTSIAMARPSAVSRLVLESKESAVSSTSSCCSTVSHPVVITRKFHNMRPTGFALSASKKFRAPKHDMKQNGRDTVIQVLENDSETASVVAAASEAVNQSNTALSDIYEEKSPVFEIIRRPHFDLSRNNSTVEEEGWEGNTPLPLPATVPVVEDNTLIVPTSDDLKVSEMMIAGRRVSFHIHQVTNDTPNHPPYLDKISPLTSSGSEEYFKQDNSLVGQRSASGTYASSGMVIKTPRSLLHHHRHHHGGSNEPKEVRGPQFTIPNSSNDNKYPLPLLSPLVRYTSKSSDMIPTEEESQQSQQKLPIGKNDEEEYKNNDDKGDKSVTQIHAIDQQQPHRQRDEEKSNSNNNNHNQVPAPLDSLGSIQSSGSHAFPSGSNSSVLSSKVSMITIATEDLLAQLPCGHIFHKECILEWANHNTTCPVCRKDLTSGLVVRGNEETYTETPPPPLPPLPMGFGIFDDY